MPLSDTLLSILAFRLAVAVLIGVVGTVLPARSDHTPHHVPAVIMTDAAPPQAASADGLALDEMLSHD